MSGINFMGSYSGIDRSTIDQLMEVERLPLKQYNTKKTSITEQQNAWKDINTRLNSLFERIKGLSSSDTFTSKISTSTNKDFVSMSTGPSAGTGTYKVNIQQLATSTRIIGNKPNGELAEGKSFTIGGTIAELSAKFKTENKIAGKMSSDQQKEHDNYIAARTITIGEDATLNDVAKEINSKSKETGVNASVIDGRMVLSNENTGDDKVILAGIEALESLGLEKISENSYDSETGDLRANLGINGSLGKNAKFTINGVDIEGKSNQVSGIIEGLTINLTKAHEAGQSDTVTVGLDTAKTTKAIQDFVDQYNSTIQFIEDKLAAGDPEIPGSSGALSGDGSLMRLHSSLRNLVTSSLNTDSKYSDISQLGVSTIDRFGKLQFESSKLNEALEENPQDVINFFYGKDEEGNELGFVGKVNTYIDSFISTSNGIIKSKSETYDKAIKDINRQIENFTARMERKEQLYIKRFSALDVAMMQAESQMSWLVGQIESMNASKG